MTLSFAEILLEGKRLCPELSLRTDSHSFVRRWWVDIKDLNFHMSSHFPVSIRISFGSQLFECHFIHSCHLLLNITKTPHLQKQIYIRTYLTRNLLTIVSSYLLKYEHLVLCFEFSTNLILLIFINLPGYYNFIVVFPNIFCICFRMILFSISMYIILIIDWKWE